MKATPSVAHAMIRSTPGKGKAAFLTRLGGVEVPKDLERLLPSKMDWGVLLHTLQLVAAYTWDEKWLSGARECKAIATLRRGWLLTAPRRSTPPHRASFFLPTPGKGKERLTQAVADNMMRAIARKVLGHKSSALGGGDLNIILIRELL